MNNKLIQLTCLISLTVGTFNTMKAQDPSRAETFRTESSTPMEDMYIDDIVKKNLTIDNRVLPYQPIREADIAWEKRIWRLIDTREKMNLPFRYPQKPFFSILRELAENGDIALFKDEGFREILTVEDLNNIMYRTDTTTVFDYDEYIEKIQVTKSEINWEDIKKYRIKEIWFFDTKTSTMKVRTIGISPIKDEYDDLTGQIKYSLPLFWVYYPEVREHLARHRVFNEFNDAAPMTWADLMEARFFSSYIFKASNVNDVTLDIMFEKSPNPNMDVLLQSERIKQELFNFEHDLWSY
ncbi:MAG TPA: gliding motility protein GldN [Saprospiraceae bacterium]|nr:gliding motility protein GldN [Saprospiraceae bacterium]